MKILSITQREDGNILIETESKLRHHADVLIDSTCFEYNNEPHHIFSNISVFMYLHADGVLIPYDIRDIDNKLVCKPNYINEYFDTYVIQNYVPNFSI